MEILSICIISTRLSVSCPDATLNTFVKTWLISQEMPNLSFGCSSTNYKNRNNIRFALNAKSYSYSKFSEGFTGAKRQNLKS